MTLPVTCRGCGARVECNVSPQPMQVIITPKDWRQIAQGSESGARAPWWCPICIGLGKWKAGR